MMAAVRVDHGAVMVLPAAVTMVIFIAQAATGKIFDRKDI